MFDDSFFIYGQKAETKHRAQYLYTHNYNNNNNNFLPTQESNVEKNTQKQYNSRPSTAKQYSTYRISCIIFNCREKKTSEKNI